MIKNYFLIYFFLISINSFSQAHDTAWEKTSENIILFSPLNLVDPVNPSFCLGFEHYFNNRIGALVDLGVITPNGLWAVLMGDNTKHSGYKVRGEIMFALRDIYATEVYGKNHYKKFKRNIRFFPYVAIDCFYIKNSYAKNSLFSYPIGDSAVTYMDGYNVLKEKKGVNLKFGFKFHVRQLVVTAYGGLGIVNRKVVHSNREDLSHDLSYESGAPKYTVLANEKGNRTYLNPVLNVKVGYSFYKFPPRSKRKRDDE